MSDHDTGTDDILQQQDIQFEREITEANRRLLMLKQELLSPAATVIALTEFLSRNREGLMKKYDCHTVRFQVYEKNGKAALKATPVRARPR